MWSTAARNKSYDVIFMDLHMPEVDGFGVAVWASLGLNVAAAGLGSWLSPVSKEESVAAEACRREVVDDDASLPVDQAGFVERLTGSRTRQRRTSSRPSE